MTNLQELTLFLFVCRDRFPYIDGVELRNDILLPLTQLSKLQFSIHTEVTNFWGRLRLPWNEDVQRTFRGHPYGQVGSSVRRLERRFAGISHVYSLPYAFDEFPTLDNSFQGGLFEHVRSLTMKDEHPFEHEFFQLVSRSFVQITELCIHNTHPQTKRKPTSIVVHFPCLTRLDLRGAHFDYDRQFLSDRMTNVPGLTDLDTTYKALVIVTACFTNYTTRAACAKLTTLHIDDLSVRPERFQRYFPSLSL